MSATSLWARFCEELAAEPLLVLALSSALVAMATTPIAFAVLGRLEWFKARRGRVMQRPEFSSIVVFMLLVMGIPAILAALILKSRSFDKNRYEFDPNRTWSVLEQGRAFASLEEADAAVKQEMQRLALERKNLVEDVKKLDEAMLALRSVAVTSPVVAQRFPSVLQSLARVRKSVGLDGPQQLLDYTAPPVDQRPLSGSRLVPDPSTGPAGVTASAVVVSSPSSAVASGAGSGLDPLRVQAEVAATPEAQRPIAAMLPLADLPPGWEPGKSGERYLETFNPDNLYEKIDGRAESFLQYGVKGMAYAFLHPSGDPSNELQIYIFEMADSLKALGKYRSEKPDEATPIAVGDEGYTSAGSTLFYSARFYTQIVSTKDDPKFASFALELARRVAARQRPETATAAPRPSSGTAVSPGGPGFEGEVKSRSGVGLATSVSGRADPRASETPAEITPATLFALLPAEKRLGEPKYVAQDVFGYSFLSDVFMADYKDGDVTWQGFVRPYRNSQEARAVFEKYIAGVKKDGGEIKALSADGADEIVASRNIGLVDVVFRKGNTLAGANGATGPEPAEAFARALARSLPGTVSPIENGK
jgi:hypothetical protein